jgi:kynureninase
MDVPNGYEITKELARRNVLVDFRPGAGIRVAPHFYTTDDELEVTMKEIRTLAYQTA